MRELSIHYKEMLHERRIKPEWAEATLNAPDRTEQKNDGTVHYIKQIQDNDGRWLRVIVNETVNPHKIITAFFDRRLRMSSYENKN